MVAVAWKCRGSVVGVEWECLRATFGMEVAWTCHKNMSWREHRSVMELAWGRHGSIVEVSVWMGM